ncbi:MAG TPA: TatD family hydrolase [Gammaproteobacteria bacterium]|nr:TatD family hydrolase [Gammaproteobacteria bacterium]
MYVDTHCHLQLLDYSKLGIDMDAVVQQAVDNQVFNMICVATHMDQSAELYHIAEKYINVKISIGLHPNEEIAREPSSKDYVQAADHASVIAIGETGLDYYRIPEGRSDLIPLQQERFRSHIEAAKLCRKPLIVHTRNAKQDTLRIIRDEYANTVGGVLHCFTEDLDMALQAIDLNFYISFSGIVTFHNAKALQDVARTIPLDRLLIETDSPWLAPEPKRGHMNLPANVKYVAEFIAQLRGITTEEVAKQTTQNYLTLFKRENGSRSTE